MTNQIPQLSLIIPVYNERDCIRPLIDEIDTALAGRLRYEVVVVDDASVDGTTDVLGDLSRTHEALQVKFHVENRGQSAAILTGVKAASAPVIAVLDGDGQNDPADVPGLYERLCASTKIRMVVGERHRRKDSRLKLFSSRVANAVRRRIL
ncbi:MAG: glycosyltransferase family 2 protein, partial [Proteobacteria bacterium]|nr:glycosyltransferase family 2 protein [Pseudomonadota bacterium]